VLCPLGVAEVLDEEGWAGGPEGCELDEGELVSPALWAGAAVVLRTITVVVVVVVVVEGVVVVVEGPAADGAPSPGEGPAAGPPPEDWVDVELGLPAPEDPGGVVVSEELEGWPELGLEEGVSLLALGAGVAPADPRAETAGGGDTAGARTTGWVKATGVPAAKGGAITGAVRPTAGAVVGVGGTATLGMVAGRWNGPSPKEVIGWANPCPVRKVGSGDPSSSGVSPAADEGSVSAGALTSDGDAVEADTVVRVGGPAFQEATSAAPMATAAAAMPAVALTVRPLSTAVIGPAPVEPATPKPALAPVPAPPPARAPPELVFQPRWAMAERASRARGPIGASADTATLVVRRWVA